MVTKMCQANGCCTSYVNKDDYDLAVVPHYFIHAIPGAVFGKESEMEQLNIFEGETADLYALFFGVKPFEFSYSRIADGPLEIRHIEQVDDYSYKLTTGREGVYKLLAVKDKYCSYSVN